MGYLTPAQMPVTDALASHFPVSDRFFCSVLGQTLPNRRYYFSATSSGQVNDDGAGVIVPAANGTIFDPRVAPDLTLSAKGTFPAAFDGYGFRVPLTIVSPWGRPRYVSHKVSDLTSILAFIEHTWNLPPMTRRDAGAWGPARPLRHHRHPPAAKATHAPARPRYPRHPRQMPRRWREPTHRHSHHPAFRPDRLGRHERPGRELRPAFWARSPALLVAPSVCCACVLKSWPRGQRPLGNLRLLRHARGLECRYSGRARAVVRRRAGAAVAAALSRARAAYPERGSACALSRVSGAGSW